jgi:hypothetical protein
VKNYQSFVNGTNKDDFHADSSPRSAADWETETGAHIQYTPVDNLALFGWLKFKAKKDKSDTAAAAQGTRRLGWPRKSGMSWSLRTRFPCRCAWSRKLSNAPCHGDSSSNSGGPTTVAPPTCRYGTSSPPWRSRRGPSPWG